MGENDDDGHARQHANFTQRFDRPNIVYNAERLYVGPVPRSRPKPYLVDLLNRWEQEQGLLAALRERRKRPDPGVLVCLVAGHQEDHLHSFFSRYQHGIVQKLIGDDERFCKPMNWRGAATLEDLKESLAGVLGADLGSERDAGVDGERECLGRALQGKPSFITVWYWVPWNRSQEAPIRAWVDWWIRLGSLASSRLIVVLIGVEWPRAGRAVQWRLRSHPRQQFAQFAKKLDSSVLVLPELRAISLDDAVQWASDDAPAAFEHLVDVPGIEHRVRKLFAKGSRPMREVRDDLCEIIGAEAGR
jgi:hypothetical protein